MLSARLAATVDTPGRRAGIVVAMCPRSLGVTMMSDSSADRDPLDRLAEEFVARHRAGERPSLTEYANCLPDRAAEIHDLFPALVELEQLKPVIANRTNEYTPPAPDLGHPGRVGE